VGAVIGIVVLGVALALLYLTFAILMSRLFTALVNDRG
jgi:hypothetical protein